MSVSSLSFNYNYIQKKHHSSILNFQYRASNTSYVYKYITSPLSESIVNMIPKYIAPNLITLIAFILILILNSLILFYSSTNGTENLPNSIIVLCGLLYLSYHILDCCDGKQARRLKKGSPLGYFMDHNLDSFTTVLLLISSMSIFRFTNNFHRLIVYSSGTIPFFLATIEEYHTGIMNLPSINGVDEGAFIGAGFFIFTGIVGGEFWERKVILNKETWEMVSKGCDYIQKILYNIGIISSENMKSKGMIWIQDLDLRYNHILLLFLITVSLIHIILNITHISKSNIRKEHPIYNLSLFLIVNITLFIVITYSDKSSIMSRHSLLVFYLFGGLFSKLTGLVQLSYIGNYKFNQKRKSVFLICSMLLASLILLSMKKIRKSQFDKAFLVLTLFSLLSYSHFFVKVTDELCEILRIRKFSLRDLDNKAKKTC